MTAKKRRSNKFASFAFIFTFSTFSEHQYTISFYPVFPLL
ncbi:hypothetical protein CHCC15087_4763 [Bacillus licheniformis]|nr:hypothetical protein CHCC20369_0966 [Bacillus licheniformis]TWL74949.1 hypothetical protein CHCC15315_1888 [Bacillus licheniformis]TWM23882.1 hypothetical protein CHCC15087_4763 [Bacillus licheniformis]